MSVDGHAFAFVIPSSWIGSNAARPSDSDIRLPLVLTHHSWANHREAFWVGNPPPASFIPVGTIEILAEDDIVESDAHSSWDGLALQILLQWRWDHDRNALLIEEEEEQSKQVEERRNTEARRAEMLSTLTLDRIVNRDWFENWDEEEEGQNLPASRLLIRNLVERLRQTSKLTKAVARRLLRETVKDFNRLDAGSHFIETTHREDICEALEIVMAAARHVGLADEIEEWKEW